MKLGLSIGYSGAELKLPVDKILLAERLGKEMMIRRGFGDAAQRIQELFLAKRKDEANAAVPDEFCDEMSLVGPVARIRERYRAWAECGITGLTLVTEQPEAMELMASLAR